MGTGSFPGVKSGRGVMLTPHLLLVPWSCMSRAVPVLPLWAVRPVQSLSACTRVHFTFFIISFVMWGRLSVRPSAWNNSAPTGQIFMKYGYEYFSKICQENASYWNRRRTTRTVHEDQNTRVLSYLAHCYLEWVMFQTKVVEKIKTHILCSVTPLFFFRKSCRLWNMWKNIILPDRPHNMAHCMMDT